MTTFRTDDTPTPDGEALTIEMPTLAMAERGDGTQPRGTTTLPASPSAVPATPRRVGGIGAGQVFNVLGAAFSAGCLTLLLFGRIAPFSGLIGAALVFMVLFIGIFAVLTALTESGPAVIDSIMTVLMWTAGAIVAVALAQILLFVTVRGWTAFHHKNFFTQDLSRTSASDPLTSGGLYHALIGTLWEIGIALLFTVPIGLVAAVYLSESRGRVPRIVRTVVQAMTALPSVVAGLFVFLTWELLLHHQKSGFAAALALSIMMLPIVVRAGDLQLRLVPGNLREASAALGAPAWRTVWHVVLPTARSGLATAVILGTARGIGETSPVLLTAGYTRFLNNNPLSGPMVSLPLAVFKLISTGQPTMIARGFAAALELLILVLILFITARMIGGRGPGHVSARGRKRNMRRSAADAERMRRNQAGAPQNPQGATL
jgi:phosphate transport system permease protein